MNNSSHDHSTTDWRPACGIEILKLRARMLAHVRTFFCNEGYMEVETPLLSSDVVIDAHIDPITTKLPTLDRELYLQTSPEAGMKRLLAAGSGSIYQITRSFRAGECGPLHNPEFTMVEWYGVDTYERDQMQFTERLIRFVSQSLAADEFNTLDLDQSFQHTRYDSAFERTIGFSVLNLTASELRTRITDAHLLPTVDDLPTDKDDLLNLLLAEHIEPQLGRKQPEFLTEYPASQAALAEICETDPEASRRFELYIDGIELCNGYHELTDADVLQKREHEQNQLRIRLGKEPLPGAAYLIAAMKSGLPQCSGVALGFDRMVMLFAGKTSLSDIVPFPIGRA